MSQYGPNSKRNSYQGDPSCRSCTDFKTWTKRQRDALHMSSSAAGTNENKQQIPQVETQNQYRDCPLDKNELGRATWGLLHSISVTIPEHPTETQRRDLVNLMNSLAQFYPCEYCARDLRNELIKEPVDASSQHNFAQWLCRLHNRVNTKIGKPIFDCSKVYERWRDGWLDGSCD
ncbi:unnamed protein product [Hermetia illucens]|uniref:Sulfhydryl oxidase n=1 Tax=Hermetia illucens TaxID=343691 RepID=A0A7R8UB93_HERIL|nr:FAD-linked sulfhydryl oxidase ALR [Hermetia illucens]CAD7077588.1 unnamed protein product [Hermetia illucens]